ncbi:MAG TPA: heavy metal sensor histidine kinase, partial [Gemmataceae bacterium]|nr:heavy metal sensor histidine kinase [Gemmataceae bacterium]
FGGHEGFDFQITRADGSRFFANRRLGDRTLPLPDQLTDEPAFRDAVIEDTGRWRVVSVRASGPDGPLTIQVARSLAGFDHEMAELVTTLLVIWPLTLLVTAGAGYVLARKALGPVDRITQAADRITAEELSRRVEVANPDDELGALAQTLNRMIGRLERSFAEMRQFTADAAHELRTPLAVIRSEAEVALRADRTPDEYRRVIENLLDEATRLGGVADQLLFLCRQDAGLLPPVREELDAGRLIRDVVENMRVVADEKMVTLTADRVVPCRVVSDGRLVRRVLYNLLDNAIKYTDPGGRVEVTSAADGGSLTVTVSDTGIGIPPEHLSHVFERFYRADPARAGDRPGAGLGLAICRSIVRTLGGSIALESSPGVGTTVRVVLPLDAPAIV